MHVKLQVLHTQQRLSLKCKFLEPIIHTTETIQVTARSLSCQHICLIYPDSKKPFFTYIQKYNPCLHQYYHELQNLNLALPATANRVVYPYETLSGPHCIPTSSFNNNNPISAHTSVQSIHQDRSIF